MHLGVDASNLRAGGGLTHLVELLQAADPRSQGFGRVTVWGSAATLAQIDDKPWLRKSAPELLNRGLAFRTYWQRYRLPSLAREAGCDVLFVPGGSFAGEFRPLFTMSRNLLPFEKRESSRYRGSLMWLRLQLLRALQIRTLRRADGVIFLTRYAKEVLLAITGPLEGVVATIPHGVDQRFIQAPRVQHELREYSPTAPMRILYVSIIDWYKHQWNVADAVARLREEGLPLELELVGPSYAPALQHLARTLTRVDPKGEIVTLTGPVPRRDLPARYARSDVLVFASSCENMPNILLEGMASGLPIACSSKGPMPEVLENGGVFFDPEDVADITNALRRLVESAELRQRTATAAFARAQSYSWSRCASATFEFARHIATQRSARSASGARR